MAEIEPVDVAIVGAGPCGLTLACMLGLHGVRVTVVEERPTLIDYPRGVGLDDESLRTFQTLGLVDDVLEHVVPDQLLIYLDSSGRELARLAPSAAPYGWPRRNGFVQPLVDAAILRGLERHTGVDVLWAHAVEGFEQRDDRVELAVRDAQGAATTIAARYVVGCDGGASMVRKQLGVAFDGMSSSTSWLVADLRNDPVGTPNSYVGCDPARPYVSIGLPHGIRRFEFRLADGEGEEMAEPEHARSLIARFVPDPDAIDLLRARVYTHHARLASSFVSGRVMIAGDAAHLMPVWQGQGYNTGIRDASNLGWKLAYVLKGWADRALLETYDVERRPHAAAMVRLSELTGRFVSPTNRAVARLRDTTIRALRIVPPLRDYFVQMRFKPMPRYTAGAVVIDPEAGASSPAGQLFVQPDVVGTDGARVKLDDVLGHRLAVIQWGVDPRTACSAADLERLRAVGAIFVAVLPPNQMRPAPPDEGDLRTVGDVTGALRTWFDAHPTPVVVVRPDRIVAAACHPANASATLRGVWEALHLVVGQVDG